MISWSRAWRYVVVMIGFALLVLLVADFNSRMADLRRLAAEKEQVSAQVTDLAATQIYLETQIANATSDAAVYQWAYEEGRMSRSEDHLVVPIQPSGSTPVPTPTPIVTPHLVSNWQVWLSLFVDSMP